jgi:hypothetical protein
MNIHFNSILFYACVFQVVFFSQVSPPNPCMPICLLHVPHAPPISISWSDFHYLMYFLSEVYTTKASYLALYYLQISVQWNQRDAILIQFIENQGSLHVSSITCSSSGGSLQPCHSQLIEDTLNNQIRLWSAFLGWVSKARNTQRALILNKLNEKFITLVSLYWYIMMHGQLHIKL